MIPLNDALQTVLSTAFTLASEQVPLNRSLQRILAENVISDVDMPPFNKSAMDGYACRKEDLKNELTQIEIIPAGKAPQQKILKNQCAKIMTGAMLPDGADCVIMLEHTQLTKNNKIRFVKQETSTNISYKAEDIKAGDVVLTKGTQLQPQHIAVLASVGCINPLVAKQPRLGVIATGSELVEPYLKPGISQIRNSNAQQLLAQITKMGVIANYTGIAGDSEEETYNAIIKTLPDNDVIIITGGVSVGDYDFVPAVLEKATFNLLFQTIAIQPGKPTVFGVSDNKRCFGLPGNPVSSFTLFELLVKPLVFKMMGMDYHPVNIRMPMAVDYQRRKVTREKWLPVVITTEGTVLPAEYHGSAHIHALCHSHGLISVPIGKETLKKGDIVHVRQI